VEVLGAPASVHCVARPLQPDGRKREAALRVTSGGAPSAFLLALALRRLNDWVPQVRSAARETLPELASNSEPQDVANALWSLLAHWSTWGRMEPADSDAVVAIASSQPVALALRSKIMDTTAGPAAFVLSQCVRSATFDCWIQEFAKAQSSQLSEHKLSGGYSLGESAGWRVTRRIARGNSNPLLNPEIFLRSSHSW